MVGFVTTSYWPFDARYASASIGIFGFDVEAKAIKAPSVYKDIMSYCDNVWVSDYTYRGIMDYRQLSPIGRVVGASSASEECLLVSGKVEGDAVVLEPAFTVVTSPQLPAPGPFTLQLQNEKGEALLQTSFEAHAIADLPGRQVKHFAFTVPLRPAVKMSLARLEVKAGNVQKALRTARRVSGQAREVRPAVSMRMRSGEAHLSWDAMAHPKVIVRDPRTGGVLSIADGGSLTLATDAPELDVAFSDGVLSTQQRLAVQ